VKPRLTIFSIPKPFVGHSAVIQENALKSWVALDGVEVILFGDDQGVAEAASRHSLRHVPDIEKSELGTPLISAAFEKVETIAEGSILCYVNGDIVFFDDLLRSLSSITFDRYMLVGRRSDMDVSDVLDLHDASVRERLRLETAQHAELRSAWNMDYFIYPRGIDWRFPPFVVGRAGWDGWLIRRARELRLPVVDLTADVLVLHQNHDYEHVPQRTGYMWNGPENDRNMEMIGGLGGAGTIFEATHELKDGRIKRVFSHEHLRARILRAEHNHPSMRLPLRMGRNIVHRTRNLLGLNRSLGGT
jgi:hypothetical protein